MVPLRLLLPLVTPNEWKGLPRPEVAAQWRTATGCHDGRFGFSSTHPEGEIMGILYVGIDLAKNVFAVHGVNEAGSAELRQPNVARAKLHAADRCAAAVRGRHGNAVAC